NAPSGLRVLVDLAGRSASAQMKWASKLEAGFAVFVPSDAAGYAVRDLGAGKDAPHQTDVPSLRAWLMEQAATVSEDVIR
ncbi:MAG TPA: hypothetical protein VJX91_03210, partial [Candidatus Eisenbacteria bacterium]|nr:hypothetical protein [Candidatus Eisenbacteria bacterium]